MFDLLKARIRHGRQYIPQPAKSVLHKRYRGFPLIDEAKADTASVSAAVAQCPSRAIATSPLSIDLGKCIFCGGCASISGSGITFSNFHKTAATKRESLIITSGETPEKYYARSVQPSNELKSLFKRSMKIRSVSAGGCNACELELNACNNVNFDMGRYGIEVVSSPRHADALIVTGPVSRHMSFALANSWEAMPAPKILVLMGSCAISGGIFAEGGDLDRSFIDEHTTTLFIPGCPSHPLAVMNGLTRLLGWNNV